MCRSHRTSAGKDACRTITHESGELKPLNAAGRRTRLDAHLELLRAGGSRVIAVVPDPESLAAMGLEMDVMDLSRRPDSARAGHRMGRALIGELADFMQ